MKSVIFCSTLAFVALSSQARGADLIPYPGSGVLNPITYTFTAASTGTITAYFAGSGAAYTNLLGMRINGVLSGAGFGLNNHTSAIGDSFVLGAVTAGDTLTFVLHNLTLGADAYSDHTLNAAYDSLFSPSPSTNHVYSTPYTATGPVFAGVPVGTYVAFEDLPVSFGSDFNYFDESFVFTNVATLSVPEPGSLTLAGLAIAGMSGYGWRRRKQRQA